MPSITNYIRFLPDRMYNVRLLLDRAGAIVERYAYDSYGRPRIRESCGRGDMNDDTKLSSTDTTRFDDANDDTIWDPRADMDDDGDVDANDETLYDNKYSDWSGAGPPVDPRQAFSDKDNPFMFQGIPHFALDTASNATEGKLMLNHHRARFADPVTGRWVTKDPLSYHLHLRDRQLFQIWEIMPLGRRILDDSATLMLSGVDFEQQTNLVLEAPSVFEYLGAQPQRYVDPSGLCHTYTHYSCTEYEYNCNQSKERAEQNPNYFNISPGPCYQQSGTNDWCFRLSQCTGTCSGATPPPGQPGPSCLKTCLPFPGPIFGCGCQ